MKRQPPTRPLSALSLAELRKALIATEQAAGHDSFSANELRKAINAKQEAQQTTEGQRSANQ